ncbi:hypothetical protein RhiirA5_464776 [Rhizophagus irregularis]|uniref:Uncharacterized protein n=1 Tax=Rhizophagus irregularis TaxID=588596 RepID=A0A2N0PZD9_9GLOM|nr:hypothetical protein RhiirA5_464776 [Rhizophagus irregularis]
MESLQNQIFLSDANVRHIITIMLALACKDERKEIEFYKEAELLNKINQETESKKISIIQGALDFIYYIRDYWCGDLAIGWCKYGRIVVANLLQVPLEQIPTTNNHLESFNSELKKRYESYALFSPKERIQLENHYNQLVYYTPDSKRDEAAERICKEKKIIQIEFNVVHVNILEHQFFGLIGCDLQPPHPKYYNTLDHQNLPYISLPTRDEAVKKFETNQVHSYHNSEIPSLSLLPQDSLHNPETTPTSHNEYEKTFHNPETPPPSSQNPKKFSLSLYDQENREPVHSLLNHNVAIWKQEHITLATNLLANLNELELIAKSIKQLSVNVPDGIKEDAKQLNIVMAFILEKIDENEDIKKLRDISNKIWKERNTQEKRNKHMLKENIYPLSPSKKQRRHDSHSIF